MVVEAVRTYLDAAGGFTKLTRQRAVMAARILLRESEARHGPPAPVRPVPGPGAEEPPRASVAAGIQTLAEELLATSEANRAALEELVERAVARALREAEAVPREEHLRLQRRVADLERRLAALTDSVAAAPPHEPAQAGGAASDALPPAAHGRGGTGAASPLADVASAAPAGPTAAGERASGLPDGDQAAAEPRPAESAPGPGGDALAAAPAKDSPPKPSAKGAGGRSRSAKSAKRGSGGSAKQGKK